MKQNKSLVTQEPKLTLKQRRFLQLYFETGNATQSAMKVYDTTDYFTAANIGAETLKNLKVPVRAWMEANGFSLKVLMGVLTQGLQATKIHGSMTEPDKEVVDYPTRHKYMETAGRWLGIEENKAEPPENLKRRIVAEEFFDD